MDSPIKDTAVSGTTHKNPKVQITLFYPFLEFGTLFWGIKIIPCNNYFKIPYLAFYRTVFEMLVSKKQYSSFEYVFLFSFSLHAWFNTILATWWISFTFHSEHNLCNSIISIISRNFSSQSS